MPRPERPRIGRLPAPRRRLLWAEGRPVPMVSEAPRAEGDEPMSVIDLAFELRGTAIPLDYGYALFSALCRVVPELHGDRGVGVHPIRGVRRAPGRLTLVPQSRLRLRM